MFQSHVRFLLTRTQAEEAALDLTNRALEVPGYSDVERSKFASGVSPETTLVERDQRAAQDQDLEALFDKFCAWLDRGGSGLGSSGNLAKAASLSTGLIEGQVHMREGGPRQGQVSF